MTTSLTAFRDHARAMADHPTTPDSDRRLWQQLAAEIDDYLDADDPLPVEAEPDTAPLF